YISHRLDEVQQIADRVVGLRDGRNAGVLVRGEINRDRMVRMMVGRDLDDFYVHASQSAAGDPEWFTVSGLRTLKYPQHEISFSVGRGEVLGFAGLVGAGRSEVARGVFGADRSFGARITLAGKRLNINSPRDAIAAGLYLVPEDRRASGLIVDFTIRENISLPGLKRYAKAALVNAKTELSKASEM